MDNVTQLDLVELINNNDKIHERNKLLANVKVKLTPNDIPASPNESVPEKVKLVAEKVKWNKANEQFTGSSGCGHSKRSHKVYKGAEGHVVRFEGEDVEVLWNGDDDRVPRRVQREQVKTIRDADYSDDIKQLWSARKVFGSERLPDPVQLHFDVNPKFEMWIGTIPCGTNFCENLVFKPSSTWHSPTVKQSAKAGTQLVHYRSNLASRCLLASGFEDRGRCTELRLI